MPLSSEVRSERATLSAVLALLRSARRLYYRSRMQDGEAALDMAEHELVELLGQVRQGIHANPPSLVLFGNPPMRGPRARTSGGPGRFQFVGRMSKDVHELRYTHVDDGKSYKHVFESGDVEMWAIDRAGRQDVLLSGGSSQPLWKDF